MHDIGLEESLNPPCRALAEKNTYLCIPLQAHGHALGIVHIVFDGIEPPPHGMQRIRQLANATADNISLALANLRLRESLESLSIRDPLTGLYNRRFMEEEADRSISRMTRLQKPLAVAFLDIDHFKDYNDKFGHDAGDVVMQAIAKLMERFRHGSDVACRYGGEEFVVVMPETGPDRAKRKMERFRNSVRQLSLKLNGQTLPSVDISVGLSIFPDHGRTTAELLKQADNALYHAKQRGRNCLEMAGRECSTPDQSSMGNLKAESTISRAPAVHHQDTSSGQQRSTRPQMTQAT
jgi:diguanylate cyclase (GGDEF)-like protein